VKPPTGWKRRFDDPIVLPDGHRLVTLQDAGTYITELPKAEHEAPEWQKARAMNKIMTVKFRGSEIFGFQLVVSFSSPSNPRDSASSAIPFCPNVPA
jgi:hypothetical protein